MPQESVLIIDDRRDTVRFLKQQVLNSDRYRVQVAHDGQEGIQRALEEQPDLIILHLAVSRQSGLRVLEGLREAGSETPVIAIASRRSGEVAARAYQLGATQYVVRPLSVEQVQGAIEKSLALRRLRAERDLLSSRASTARLEVERRSRELNVLASISRSVVALLDEERLMSRVVDAAVYLTDAQEGFLFLLDEESGELVLRAERGSHEMSARQFDLKVGDSLVRQVVETGRPVIVSGTDEDEALTADEDVSARPLIHVPLKVGERVLGILSVDHQTREWVFGSHDVQLLSLLGDAAAIALDHARLRTDSAKDKGLERSSLQGALDGLDSYREQVRTCIQSARSILTDLREQAVSFETRLAEIASKETILSAPETQTGAFPGVGSELKLKAILDNVRDGILVIDGEDKVELANQAASVMLGRALMGQEVSSVCADPRWYKTYQIVRAAAQIDGGVPGSQLTSATTALTGDQSALLAAFRARPVLDRAYAGTVVVLRDITAERDAERARDSFVASISQDLRTPMTSIGGYADLLLSGSMGALSDAQEKLACRILGGAQQIEGLLDDLTGMAVSESKQLPIRDEVVDLTAVVHEACGMMRAHMAEKDQIIELNLDSNLPVVQADADAMFHVLTNLLENAHRCSPEGARIVLHTVKMHAPADDGDASYVVISVADRGGGIVPEDRRRVFDRTYRLAAPSVHGLGDPGVNLPMVKALVEASGGRVWLDSTPGTGSTFTLVLPVWRRTAPVEPM